jgi:hypothetical protein
VARCGGAKGAAIGVAWWHCQSCRKHSGAPVSVFVAIRRDANEVTKGGDHQIQLVTRPVAGLLRQIWIHLDVRRRTLVHGNAFPHWLDRSGRTVSTDQAHISGRAPALAARVMPGLGCFRRAVSGYSLKLPLRLCGLEEAVRLP